MIFFVLNVHDVTLDFLAVWLENDKWYGKCFR